MHLTPFEEEERLRILRSHGILDTPAEIAFDRVTSLCTRIFDVPIAAVSLVYRDRQFFKSCFGLDVRETPREAAFCSRTILEPGVPMVVEDATTDPRFEENPLVVGPPYIRFYAGVPVMARNEAALGSLCIIDRRPRRLDERELAILVDLASVVEEAIGQRDRTRSQAEVRERHRELQRSVSQSIGELRCRLPQVVSRELRTPLHGILGFADLLNESLRDTKQHDAVHLGVELHEAALRMERSVTKVCLFTELRTLLSESGAGGPFDRVDANAIHEVVSRVASRMAAAAEREGDLRVRMMDGIVQAPGGYLQTMIEEIVENAFKFSSSGSPVVIEGQLVDDGYRVTIRDYGVSMDSDAMESLRAFFRFDEDAFEPQRGLGLTLVRLIAAVSGAKVEIAAAEGSGVVIGVLFSACPADALVGKAAARQLSEG